MYSYFPFSTLAGKKVTALAPVLILSSFPGFNAAVRRCGQVQVRKAKIPVPCFACRSAIGLRHGELFHHVKKHTQRVSVLRDLYHVNVRGQVL